MSAGRPTTYKKKFCQEFIELSKKGKSLTQIAARFDVHRDTLYEWGRKHPEFSDAMKKGRILMENWYSELGQAALTGQLVNGKPVHLGFYVWLTKNICHWSDRSEVKQEVDSTSKSEVVIYSAEWGSASEQLKEES